jgi:hypothetical protein
MRIVKRRAKPGASGKGRFFHIQLRPNAQFVRFRVQDVGGRGGVERVAGQRGNGTWDTVKWLVEKTHAHVHGETLVADTAEARKLLRSLGSAPVYVRGDRFRAAPRANIPESEKPTPKQRRAWQRNIRKAQQSRRAGKRRR